jgi:copper chaperone CopZ
MGVTEFEVEHAGCESCAERVERALGPLLAIEGIDIDEAADSATVRLRSAATASVDDVNRVLASASHGSGHAYRVKPGSWQAT